MSRYLLKTQEAKGLNTLIQKYGNKIPISTEKIRGYFTILRHRNYTHYSQVDVLFEGEIYCVVNRKREWYCSKITQEQFILFKISKIKLNRLIRKSIYTSLRDYLKYFSVELRHYSEITKISWK